MDSVLFVQQNPRPSSSDQQTARRLVDTATGVCPQLTLAREKVVHAEGFSERKVKTPKQIKISAKRNNNRV